MRSYITQKSSLYLSIKTICNSKKHTAISHLHETAFLSLISRNTKSLVLKTAWPNNFPFSRQNEYYRFSKLYCRLSPEGLEEDDLWVLTDGTNTTPPPGIFKSAQPWQAEQ